MDRYIYFKNKQPKPKKPHTPKNSPKPPKSHELQNSQTTNHPWRDICSAWRYFFVVLTKPKMGGK